MIGWEKNHLRAPVALLLASLFWSTAQATTYTTSYSYDVPNGTVTTTNPDNEAIIYHYDAVNRLSKIDLGNGAGDPNLNFRYDLTDQLTDATNTGVDSTAGGYQHFDYEADFDRLKDISDFGITNLLEFSYDHQDRVTWITYGSGNGAVCYEYDPDGRIKRVGRIPSGQSATTCDDGVVEKIDYGYDGKGRLSTITYPNGTNSYWIYDPATGLVKEAGHKKGSTLIYSDNYTYYPNSRLYKNIIHATAGDSNETQYKYDDYQRLTEVLESDGRKTIFTYDDFGNRLTETITNIYDGSATGGSPKPYGTYVYNYLTNSNRLDNIQYTSPSNSTTTLESYIYDNTGRLKQRKDGNGTITHTYSYDPRGLLTQAVTPDHTIDYTYDALGVRKSKSVDGALTYYVTAPIFGLSHVLMELDPGKNIQATYVYGGNQQMIEEPIASDRSKDLYLLHDGTVGSLTDALDVNGNVKDEYRYDAFGAQTSASMTSSSYSHYGYTGEEYDDETGLVYLRARYYDPSLGRFISADPFLGKMAEPVTQNRYVYVKNNPLRYVDPRGAGSLNWQGCLTKIISACGAFSLDTNSFDVYFHKSIGVELSLDNSGAFYYSTGTPSPGLKWIGSAGVPLGRYGGAEVEGSWDATYFSQTGQNKFDLNYNVGLGLTGKPKIMLDNSEKIISGNDIINSTNSFIFDTPPGGINNRPNGTAPCLIAPANHCLPSSDFGDNPSNTDPLVTSYLYGLTDSPPYPTQSDINGTNADVGLFDTLNSYGYYNYGGVTLDKTLTLLNGLDQIQGAAYDPEKGELVFMGSREIQDVTEKIDLDDLVVAMRSVYVNQENPGITFSSDDRAKSFANKTWDIKYFGATPNTQFGEILFETDYILKQLSLGIDPSGQRLADIYQNEFSGLGYQSFAERLYQHGITLGDNGVEFWFAPKVVTMDLNDGVAQTDPKSFVFTQMDMQVFVRVLDNKGKPALDGSYDPMIKTLAQQFADNITNNYDTYSNIAAFAVLKKLKRLGKITAVARFLRDNDIPVDFSFMRDYVPKAPVTTRTQVGILQVCKDASSQVGAGSGPYDPSVLCNMSISGGVIYDLPNDYNNSAQSAIVADALSSLNRKTNPLTPGDMKWTYDSGTATLTAVAQQVAPSGKDGRVAFTDVDLAFPNQAGQSLAFTRYYDSFSGVKSGFGPGWSEVPYTLQLPNSRFCPDPSQLPSGVTSCYPVDPASKFPILFGDLQVIDRISGKTVMFASTSHILYWYDQANNLVNISDVYLSDKTNDRVYEYAIPGIFVYEQLDDNYQITKRVFFQERGTLTDPKFYADVIGVATPSGNGSDVWLDYYYDAQNRLDYIEGEGGQRITLSYDNDRISSASFSSADGTREADYTYDDGRRLDTVNRSGNTLQYFYEPRFDEEPSDYYSGIVDHVVDITHDGEETVKYASDLEARSQTTTFENNSVLKVDAQYDRVTGQTILTDSSEREIQVQRDQDTGNLLSVSMTAKDDQNNDQTLTTSNVFDARDSQGNLNLLAGPSSVTDVRNNHVEYGYADDGIISSITDHPDGVPARTTSIWRGVDDADSLSIVLVFDPKNRASVRKYDESGRLIKIYRRVTTATPVAGQTSFSFTYDDKDVTTITYDPVTGAIASVSNASGDVSLSDPDAFGQAQTVKSAAGYMTQYQYDGLARLKSVQGPADVVPTAMSYNPDGLAQDTVNAVSTPIGNFKQSLDVQNRQRTVTDPRGISTTYFYNRKRQLERVVEVSADASTILTTQYFYDAFGKLDHKLLPNDVRVNYSYDGFDHITRMDEVEGAEALGGNNPPTWSSLPSPPGGYVNPGDDFTYDLGSAATDADPNDTLIYTLAKAPDGMTIDPATGYISWTTSPTQTGTYNVAVQVVDQNGGVLNTSFDVVVGQPTVSGSPDSDGDLITDDVDNCKFVSNADQRDTDGDGYGNVCDGDFNNDGIVNFADLAILKSWFNSADPDADLNGDGVVNNIDLSIMKQMFGQAPGPSGLRP